MVKEIRKITRNEVVKMLSDYDKNSFINVVTETIVSMNKTDNPYFEKVKKHSSRNYLINSDYFKRVIVNGVKEGIEKENNPFEVEQMSGRRKLSNSVYVNVKNENKKYLYLELFDEVPPKVEYTFEGNPIDKVLFEGYQKKVYDSKKQPQDKKVKIITPLIDNICSITLDGVRYDIVD